MAACGATAQRRLLRQEIGDLPLSCSESACHNLINTLSGGLPTFVSPLTAQDDGHHLVLVSQHSK